MIEIAIGVGAGALLAGIGYAAFRLHAKKQEEKLRAAQMTGVERARDLGMAEYTKKAEGLPRDLYSFELVRAPKLDVQDVMSGEAKGKKIISCTLVRKLPGGDEESSIYAAELSVSAPHFALCPPDLASRFRQTEWDPIENVPDAAFRAAFYGFMPDAENAAKFLTPKLRELLIQRREWAFEFFHRHALLAAPKKLRGNEARLAMNTIAQVAGLAWRA
jgi:hypothetical protein